MTLRSTEWPGVLRGALMLALVCSLIPLPVAAAERGPSPNAGPIRASIDRIADGNTPQKDGTRAATARRVRQSTPDRDGSFFRSKPGMLALAVLIVGAGYAVYSTQNDRISSPGKK